MKKIVSLIASFILCMNVTAQQLDSATLEKAKKGDPETQNDLAIFYAKNGDESNAVYWWKLSADNGNVSAASNLGEFYCRKKNYREALKWLIPAAEKGNGNAAFRLALCLRDELGIAKSIPDALKWALASANKGNKDAYLLTADMYLRYYNDLDNAKIWYERAANAGIPMALNWMGLKEIENGNENKAFKYFMEAAQKGYANAQYNVGLYYYKAQQYDAAKTWLTKAAGQGDKLAINLLEKIK